MPLELKAIALLLFVAFVFGYFYYQGYRYHRIIGQPKTTRQKIFVWGHAASLAVLIAGLGLAFVLNYSLVFAIGIGLAAIALGISLLCGRAGAPHARVDKIARVVIDQTPDKHQLLREGIGLLFAGGFFLIVVPLTSIADVSRDIPLVHQLGCGGMKGGADLSNYDYCHSGKDE